MNRENAKSLLPVIQAYAEGKTIQFKDGKGDWEDITGSIAFDCIPEVYRIKPEPREFWLVCRKDSPRLPWGVWTNEPPDKEMYDIIPVIEVLK